MKTQYAIRNVTELRADFWREHLHLDCRFNGQGRPLPQNEQPASVRVCFAHYVDQLARSGSISNALAQSATL